MSSGRTVQIIGAVIDVEFDRQSVPDFMMPLQVLRYRNYIRKYKTIG